MKNVSEVRNYGTFFTNNETSYQASNAQDVLQKAVVVGDPLNVVGLFTAAVVYTMNSSKTLADEYTPLFAKK
jgi:tRNA C32,U32 (ribose-2'-O)-methylase TrmJ